jgi:membrane-associated phospholipid phosphatase
MDGILKLGVDLIMWLQSLGSWTVKPMEFLSFLGAEEFFLMVAPAVIWCSNASLGLRMCLFLMVGASVNHAFKVIFHGPRPYWADTRVLGLSVETSFGIPSGHASNAVVVWGTLAAYLRNRLAWVMAGILIFLIGLSRLALGMHYPHDVLAGWLLGAILLWVFLKVSQPVSEWLKGRNLAMKLGAAFAGSLGLILMGVITQWIRANYYIPSAWIDNAVAAHPDIPIAPFALSGLFTNAGAFFGLAAGAILLEQMGGFSTRGSWWQLMLRYLLGVAGVLAIRYGLGAIFPSGEEIGPYVLRYLRYTLIGLWVTGLAPYAFRKLKLATGKSIQPQVSVVEESKAESAI